MAEKERDNDERYMVTISLVVLDQEGKVVSADETTNFNNVHYYQLPPIEDCYVQMKQMLVDLGYGEAMERYPEQTEGLMAARAEIRGRK